MEPRIEPQRAARDCGGNSCQRSTLQGTPANRIEIGHVQRIGSAIVGERNSNVGGIVPFAEPRDDRTVLFALAPHGAHDRAACDIDNRNKFHGTRSDMANSVFVYEYLSGGGLPDEQGADPAAQHLLAQGRSMRDAIVADLVQINEVEVTCATVGDDQPVVAPQLRYVAPERGQPARDFVRALARAHDLVWVVAPESDSVLATLAAAVPPEQWIGCERSTIALASSKSLTARHLAQSEIAATRPWRPGEKAVGERWVVKPDDGAGSCDTRVFASFEDAERELWRRIEHGRATVLEPWLEGAALSASILCGPVGAEVLAINHQHIDVDEHGQLSFRGVSIDVVDRVNPLGREVERIALQVARALPGLRGYVGCDLVASPQGPVVIEVNPRLTSAYVGLSHRLGRNLARDVLAIFQAAVAQHGNHASL